jgi:hypothetical protein
MPKQFQEKLLNFMESGHIKIDQMQKQYDFAIKGAKVCNQVLPKLKKCHRKNSMGSEKGYSRCDLDWEIGTKERWS